MRIILLSATVAASVLAVPALAAPVPTGETVSRFPAAYFAPGQPYSAFDMLSRLPGFSFVGGDSAVRGFAGAGGNVLVDGQRPTSKQEGLEAILRRIPARSVERIELIRAGTPGIDMQGQPVLANVVRVRAAETRGRIEAGLGGARGDLWAPRLGGEMTRRSGDRLLELSARVAREYDTDKGRGPTLKFDPAGGLKSAALYGEDQHTDTAEAAAGYERGLAGGKLRLDLSLRQERTGADIFERRGVPSPNLETVAERERVSQAELSGRYEHDLGAAWRGEAVGLHRQSRTRAADTEWEGGDTSATSEARDARETIGRVVLRRPGEVFGLELGGEGAINVLEGASALTENGVAVPLPSAAVRVEERRAEVFVTATWRLSSRWSLEAGDRFEISRLTQSGDSRLTKTLSYWKPRLLATWTPGGADQVRFLLERRVGQLDFEDFVSSTSLTSNLTTAGNPDLEPDRTWRAQAAWERQVLGTGAVVLTVRHDRIEDVIDRVPVVGPGFAFDAPGNAGNATRSELELTLTLPLDRVAIAGGLLRAEVIWRTSRVTDPATGRARPISDEPAVEGKLHFTQDLPRYRARWGAELVLAEAKRQYRFDEVRHDEAQARLGLFAEYRPSPAWSLRLDVENLTRGETLRRREQYAGLRGAAALKQVETRRLDFGPGVLLTVQRSFGGR